VIGNGAKCPMEGVGILFFNIKEGSTINQPRDVHWIADLSRNLLCIVVIIFYYLNAFLSFPSITLTNILLYIFTSSMPEKP